jgi:hypothetical protein
MAGQEEKFIELERRLQRLEQEVFGRTKATAKPSLTEQGPQKLEDLKIPSDILSALREQIRGVGFMNLILILLYFSSSSLSYSDMMSISKELKKPVSYEWLNTEFHRKKHSGLVRSEPIPGSQEKNYSLNEPGRKRAERVLAEIKAIRK